MNWVESMVMVRVTVRVTVRVMIVVMDIWTCSCSRFAVL